MLQSRVQGSGTSLFSPFFLVEKRDAPVHLYGMCVSVLLFWINVFGIALDHYRKPANL
jgi:hypothetical protein